MCLPTQARQVNAMAIFHLLDFGSGFDAMLLAKTGRGEPSGHGCMPLRRSTGTAQHSVTLPPHAGEHAACKHAHNTPPSPATPADAREVVQFGLLGMLMHGAALESAHWLREFSGYQVFQFFNVDASGEHSCLGKAKQSGGQRVFLVSLVSFFVAECCSQVLLLVRCIR